MKDPIDNKLLKLCSNSSFKDSEMNEDIGTIIGKGGPKIVIQVINI